MSEHKFRVPLKSIIDEFSLEAINLPADADTRLIEETEINRPGLQLAGFYEYFNPERIQIVGKAEFAFLAGLDENVRRERLDMLFAQHIPALIISRELPYFNEMVELSKTYDIPLLRSKDGTSSFMAALIAFLNLNLAPRITRHGVLIEIYGEGVLILGESGVGKSETAVELIKRGHRLVADDAVEIKKVSNISLVGSSPENIRHFLELRGIGIVNARRLFGMGAVKLTEKIDMVVEMEPWDSEKVYDRMGVDNEYTSILGVKVPYLVIPVKPGRNLAVILEVAAMNNRQKKMGYNAAQELLENLGMAYEKKDTVKKWDVY
ncbi:MAG: HPr(Ser) kinase/phosphatase [Oscillospiraceae bacterium]|nr:HPr(Ser) kinase/phosphatase [Oscillospiraceae bacterium]